MLASSMKLEYPLNEALPNIEHTRDRLLAKIFHFRKEERDGIASRDEDFELLYAYGKSTLINSSQGFRVVERVWDLCKSILTTTRVALVTGQLSNEITVLGKEIEKLFGVLNEDLLKLQ